MITGVSPLLFRSVCARRPTTAAFADRSCGAILGLYASRSPQFPLHPYTVLRLRIEDSGAIDKPRLRGLAALDFVDRARRDKAPAFRESRRHFLVIDNDVTHDDPLRDDCVKDRVL